jgi:hypothetical protein
MAATVATALFGWFAPVSDSAASPLLGMVGSGGAVGVKAQARCATQPYQSQGVLIRLLIDQHQVRFDVAVTVVFPVPSQGVVTVARLKRLIGCQSGQYW